MLNSTTKIVIVDTYQGRRILSHLSAYTRHSTVIGPSKIIRWGCSTRSAVNAEVAFDIADQLVKVACTASFWANSAVGLFGAHFGAPLDINQGKWSPRLGQKDQCW